MNNRIKTNLLGFTTVLIWATAFPFTKIASEELSVGTIALVRCMSASLVLFCILLIKGRVRPIDLKEAVILSAAGLAGFGIYLLFFSRGLLYVTGATSSIIIALAPVMTAIASSFIFNEKIRPLGWICIGTAFLGVVIMMSWGGNLSINPGILWTFGAAVLLCTYTIINRNISERFSAIEIVTYGMTASWIFLLPFTGADAYAQICGASLRTIASVVFMGVFPGAIAYSVWGKALSIAEKVSEVTNYMFVTPILTTILSCFLIAEYPDMGTYIGGSVIIGSVVVFSLKGK